MIIDMGFAKSSKNILKNANKQNKLVVEGFVAKIDEDFSTKLYIALLNLIKKGTFDVILS